MDAVFRAGRDFDLEPDLMDVVGDFFRVEVELDVEARLNLPLENLRSARIFNRQVLDVLGDRRNLRLVVVLA